jgi:hypothetical protein
MRPRVREVKFDFHAGDVAGDQFPAIGTDSPALGDGVRATRPHEVIMTRDSTEAAALAELHRQVDAIEDAAGDRTDRGDATPG